MSPDIFLSQKLRVVDMPGLRYDGSGLQGTPAEIVERLLILNAARNRPAYQTPDFVAVPTNPNTTLPLWVVKETKAMEGYYGALRSGDPSKVHAAVDAVNSIRQVKSGVELVPPNDFEIIAHANSALGEAARWLLDRREDEAQVFWSDEGIAILDAYGK